MESDTEILKLPSADLIGAWKSCLANTLPVKVSVEEEIQKAMLARVSLQIPFFQPLLES